MDIDLYLMLYLKNGKNNLRPNIFFEKEKGDSLKFSYFPFLFFLKFLGNTLGKSH